MNRLESPVLQSEGDLYSLAFLSQSLQQMPAVIVGVAAKLALRPLSIDAIPYFNNAQAQAIKEFLDTHRVVVKPGTEIVADRS